MFFLSEEAQQAQACGTRLAERHLLGLGLAGVAEQGVAGLQVFGRVDAIGAHGGLHHCHAALLLYRPVSRRLTQEGGALG